nr:MAG TPA: hypothetical protein [Crassvirales sp.]
MTTHIPLYSLLPRLLLLVQTLIYLYIHTISMKSLKFWLRATLYTTL